MVWLELFGKKQSLAVASGRYWIITVHLHVIEYNELVVTACSMALLAGLNQLQVPVTSSHPPIRMNKKTIGNYAVQLHNDYNVYTSTYYMYLHIWYIKSTSNSTFKWMCLTLLNTLHALHAACTLHISEGITQLLKFNNHKSICWPHAAADVAKVKNPQQDENLKSS